MAKVSIVTKIVPKSIGNPKGIVGRSDPNDNAMHVIGIMGGTANKLVQRVMPNGDVFWGLGGTFLGVPFKREADGEYVPDTSLPRLSSGVMYLPAGIQDVISDQLRDPETGEVREGIAIEFAFKIGTVKATNPAGYSWTAIPLIEPEAAPDPMAAILEAAGYGDAKYLPAADAAPKGSEGEAGPEGDDGAADGKAGDEGATNRADAKAAAKGAKAK